MEINQVSRDKAADAIVLTMEALRLRDEIADYRRKIGSLGHDKRRRIEQLEAIRERREDAFEGVMAELVALLNGEGYAEELVDSLHSVQRRHAKSDDVSLDDDLTFNYIDDFE